MTTMPRDAVDPRHLKTGTLAAFVAEIERLLERYADRSLEGEYAAALAASLRRLHACVRSHHANDCLTAADMADGVIPPEYLDPLDRLRGEHTALVGQLDRLIRSIDAFAAEPREDTEVFFLRIRELIATLRRHEAEENHLYGSAMWRDTGGES